ncbi:MAG: phosphoribosyl-ATP diphosphatase [Proteobacteria bacterium]|nr:phosphoribosyl-ATP diphosphatase [Pseudomonadota bacterium]MDA1323194.1 phosphoribosyl-ATP diphosphatase [Pseudomonadota bacterium]
MTDEIGDSEILQRLYAVIQARKGDDPKASYTAQLFADGLPRIAQKFGEEAVETVIAGASGDAAGTVLESADLLYHLLVLWAQLGITPDDVWAELSRREGASGLAEKAARKKS